MTASRIPPERRLVMPAAAPATLTAKEVSFAYGRTPVLRGVDVEIQPGKLTALVGPNGSGKSTLLSALARIHAVSGGAVHLDGADIAGLPTRAVARRLSILPQNPPLPEAITAFDLVSRGRHPHRGRFGGWSEADRLAVEAAMRRTGTEEFAARPVDSLSGGQRQRCWIAMALAQETAVILLDEPTAFLDLRYQIEVLDLLHTLTRDLGRTVVVALHDLSLAASHADQMIFFRDGAVCGAGATETVCTPSLIESVFGVPVIVMPHPETGHPVVLPRGRPVPA
jgi:iron complex transport system ATP-binding protein